MSTTVTKKDEMWDKHNSPVGWYIATELLRFIPVGVDPDDPRKHFLVWENLMLIQAENKEAAYQKALERGALGNRDAASGEWRFGGLTGLLAIYKDFEDGSEIMWMSYKRSASSVKRLVRTKNQLEVFAED